MTWQILALAGPRDSIPAGRRNVIRVRFDSPGHPDSPHSNVPNVLAQHDLRPAQAAFDLLRLAIAAYTADVRIPRAEAFDGWTRDLTLRVFVHELDRWRIAQATLVELLRFLTGDHWTVELRQAPETYRPTVGQEEDDPVRISGDTVCLLSGGLDSFAGALNLLEAEDRAVFVGHQAAGGGATSRAQRKISDILRSEYRSERAPFLRFWVAPPARRDLPPEPTTRSRSILFFSLAIAVASGLQARRVVVPENGFISLNVPLSPSRLGSLSTRTTHPYLIELFRTVLREIDIPVEIELPYRFQTKGEILTTCRNPDALRRGLAVSVSCSHPEASRYSAGDPNLQCGRCFPCVVRRAAIARLGPDPTRYYHTDLSVPLAGKSGLDLRVLLLGLRRFAPRAPTLADVLIPGPLDTSEREMMEYLGVFARGLDEVRSFLRQFSL